MNNTVTFKVVGNDVLSFIDRIKQKSDELTSEMIANAREQADSAKDQLKIIEDQIKALERKNRLEAEASRLSIADKTDAAKTQAADDLHVKVSQIEDAFAQGKLTRFGRNKAINKAEETYEERVKLIDQEGRDQLKAIREQEKNSALQVRLLRDNIETIKSTSNQELAQMKRGGMEMIDQLDENATPIEQMARELSLERYETERGKKGGSEEGGGGASIFGGMLNVDNINRFISTVGTLTSTQNGFDLIRPTSSGLGQIIGTVAGGIIGGLLTGGTGTLVGAGVGGSIGSLFGDTVGEFEQRRAMAAQDFLQAKYRFEAQSQGVVDQLPDAAAMGVSAGEYLTTMRQIAVAAGTASRVMQNTSDVIEMERGLGISIETSSQMLTYFRGTQKDISNLVGAIMNRGNGNIFSGGDYTFLNEFMGKFNQLQMQLMQTQNTVATGATFDILKSFDKIGGPFASRDFRSMGLIGSINNALINPGSDTLNAYSFLALRQANPGLGIAGLLEERQKGLSSATYRRAMLEYVDRLGGDEDMKIMNLAGIFGLQNNIGAARLLYQNRSALMGNVSQDQLESMIGDVSFRSEAEARTTPIEKNMAEIKNGLLGTWMDSVGAMVDAFKVAMEQAFAGATIIKTSDGRIELKPGAVKQNVAPTGRKILDKKSAQRSGLTEDGKLNPMSALNKG